jgi:hypothetical protein
MTRDELVQLKKTYGVPKSVPSPPEKASAIRRPRAPLQGRPRPDDQIPRRAGSDADERARRGPSGDRPRRGPPARTPEAAAPQRERGPNTHRTSGRGSTVRTEPQRPDPAAAPQQRPFTRARTPGSGAPARGPSSSGPADRAKGRRPR